MIQSLIIITILIVIIFLIYDIYKSNNNIRQAKSEKKQNDNISQKEKNIINKILVKNFLNDEYFVGGGMCSNNVGLRARLYNNFKLDKQNMHNIKKLI